MNMRAFLATIACAFVSAPAIAQMDLQSISDWQLSSNIIHVQGLLLNEQLSGDGAQALAAPRTSVLIGFAVSGAVRAESETWFLGKFSKMSPGQSAQMASVLKTVDIVEMSARPMRAHGLTETDLADALANYWISAWILSKGFSFDTAPEAYAAASVQAAAALKAEPGFARMTDAEKQAMAERLIIDSYYFRQAMDVLRDEPRLESRFAAWARKGAAENGLDVDAMALDSETGFKPG